MPTGEFERMIKDSKGSKVCLGIHLDLLNCFIIDDQIYLPQESEETKKVARKADKLYSLSHLSLAGRPHISYLAFLHLSFLNYKMEIAGVSGGVGRNK